MDVDDRGLPQETSRQSHFAERAKTRICKEIPSADNPFIADRVLWHGYDVAELVRKRDWIDTVFLLLKGELPGPGQKRLLEQLFVILANPGPRHSATRAVMNASAFRARSHQLLPIGMSLMSGENLGAMEVDGAMRFLVKNHGRDPHCVAQELVDASSKQSPEDGRLVPGFGRRFNGIDSYAGSMVELLVAEHPESEVLRWGQELVGWLAEANAGWLMPGVAAAGFVELGLRPAVGAGIYQMAAGPGLLAHGLEMANKPLTAMPFVADENFHYCGVTDVEPV